MRKWAKALTFALLLALLLGGAVWVVRRYRPANSVTVLESATMDMGAMKAPTGATPVETALVEESHLLPTVSYPGTVIAQGDQEIAARVTGTVEEVLVYPGDRVVPGQLLVRLDNSELSARAAEARAAIAERERQVSALEAERSTREAEARVAGVGVPLAGADIASTRATLGAAQAELSTVEAEVARSRTLYANGGISLQELQQDQARLARARAALKETQQGLRKATLTREQAQAEAEARKRQSEQAGHDVASAQAAVEREQAALRSAEVQLGYTEIRATQIGEVTERVVSPGTLVSPGQVLLRIKQSGAVRLQASVPVEQATGIRPGFPVKARAGEKTVESRVSAVFGQADPRTRTLIVEAKTPPDPALVPGAYVEMEIATSEGFHGKSVPVRALRKSLEGENFVWKLVQSSEAEPMIYTCVMHPEVRLPAPGDCPKCGMKLVPEKPPGAGTVQKQLVEVGPVIGERVVIRRGLEVGEVVIAQGAQGLAEGMSVSEVRWSKEGVPELPASPPSSKETSEGRSGGHAGH
jgi:multidrug efflux pump subunit AcrA (membrane-fusion protein)